MTAPAKPLTARQRLEGELNLLPEDVGLSDEGMNVRIKLWGRIAAEREGTTPAQQDQHVKALALRAWITALTRKADKFRAEGEVTLERDVLGRVAALQVLETAARREAGLEPAPVSSGGANPAPEISPWRLGP